MPRSRSDRNTRCCPTWAFVAASSIQSGSGIHGRETASIPRRPRPGEFLNPARVSSDCVSERRAERNAGRETSDVLDVASRLVAYYTRYYRDTLGIPGWRDLVEVRLDAAAYEKERLSRLERALGRPVSGLSLLNLGCGTGGFNRAAEAAGARAWGVDVDPEAVAIARDRVLGGRIMRAAAERLPFRDGSFDVVYC